AGKMRVETELLRQISQARAHSFGLGEDVLAVERNRAQGCLEQAGDDAHERGLAGTVGPEQAEHPHRDLEINPLESGDGAGVHLHETLDPEHETPRASLRSIE